VAKAVLNQFTRLGAAVQLGPKGGSASVGLFSLLVPILRVSTQVSDALRRSQPPHRKKTALRAS